MFRLGPLRSPREPRLNKIGFIFQTHHLLPFLNATENVAEAMELAGIPPRQARARAEAPLDCLGVGKRWHAMPGGLSGGEAQRVAIARALANSPRIILADEPTAPLDSQRAGVVMDLPRRIPVDQRAAVLVARLRSMVVRRGRRRPRALPPRLTASAGRRRVQAIFDKLARTEVPTNCPLRAPYL